MTSFLAYNPEISSKMGGSPQHSGSVQALRPGGPGLILSSDFFRAIFLGKISRDSMTAALLIWWTVPRFNSHSNPFSTGESSTAKKLVAR